MIAHPVIFLLIIALLGFLYYTLRRDHRGMIQQHAKLVKSEERLGLAMSMANDGIWDWHLHNNFAEFDDRYYTMAGYAPNEFPSTVEEHDKRIHPDDLQMTRQALQQFLTGECKTYDIEFRYLRKDGDYMWIRARGKIVSRDKKGKPLRFVGTRFDISERKRIEAELASYRLHLEQLVTERTSTIKQQAQIIDRTHDSVITTDRNGHVTSWNGGAERFFGLSAEDAVGRHINLIYPEHQQELLHNEILPKMEANGVHDSEIILRRADGTEFPAHLTLLQLCDDDGTPIGRVGYTMDLSELKRREAELDHLASRLQAANKELESFAYSVSHDLRAPLRAIDGFSLALVEDYEQQLDETGLNYLQRIRKGAQRMGQLIDDLLQLSLVSRGELALEDVDLGEIAEAVLEELRTAEPERRLELTLGRGMQARGDRRLLRVMLGNLLANAWKFSAREGTARITFEHQPGNSGVFLISDNGVGFDMRHAGKLFGAFQRLHRSSDFPGTGVGLATVQRIINRHGGEIWAEAREGQGATFYFSLAQQKSTETDHSAQ